MSGNGNKLKRKEKTKAVRQHGQLMLLRAPPAKAIREKPAQPHTVGKGSTKNNPHKTTWPGFKRWRIREDKKGGQRRIRRKAKAKERIRRRLAKEALDIETIVQEVARGKETSNTTTEMQTER